MNELEWNVTAGERPPAYNPTNKRKEEIQLNSIDCWPTMPQSMNQLISLINKERKKTIPSIPSIPSIAAQRGPAIDWSWMNSLPRHCWWLGAPLAEEGSATLFSSFASSFQKEEIAFFRCATFHFLRSHSICLFDFINKFLQSKTKERGGWLVDWACLHCCGAVAGPPALNPQQFNQSPINFNQPFALAAQKKKR